MQSSVTHHLLLELPTGQYLLLSVWGPTPVLVVSRNTSECLLQALKTSVWEPESLQSVFRSTLRIALSDSYGANNKAEQHWQQQSAFQHLSCSRLSRIVQTQTRELKMTEKQRQRDAEIERRQRQRGRETERQKDRETERQRQRHRERERERQRERERERGQTNSASANGQQGQTETDQHTISLPSFHLFLRAFFLAHFLSELSPFYCNMLSSKTLLLSVRCVSNALEPSFRVQNVLLSLVIVKSGTFVQERASWDSGVLGFWWKGQCAHICTEVTEMPGASSCASDKATSRHGGFGRPGLDTRDIILGSCWSYASLTVSTFKGH